jgi:hypothetical protein
MLVPRNENSEGMSAARKKVVADDFFSLDLGVSPVSLGSAREFLISRSATRGMSDLRPVNCLMAIKRAAVSQRQAEGSAS